jgi:UDP:flavonoid glycosyltransferase YjiC (YdhE family)
MGSMGSADLKLVTRLVSIISKCSHRVIVSKGALHDKYELPDNMWGQKMIPQTKILPLIDLAITHGGNNTLTEAFIFGKPMIVMPLFGDQFDNAQRIVEKNHGIHLNAYYCSEEELLESIGRLLNDKELGQKLKKISERIQSSESTVKASQLIENLVIK